MAYPAYSLRSGADNTNATEVVVDIGSPDLFISIPTIAAVILSVSPIASTDTASIINLHSG